MDDIDSFLGTANPEDFAKVYGPAAARAGEKIGVDPKIILAQWGHETGWGKSIIPGTNNLGNIKDTSGSGVSAKDNATGSADKYQKFKTPDDFADHYADLVNRKYPYAKDSGADASKFAHGMAAGGYAEDKDYAKHIVAAHKSVPDIAPEKPKATDEDFDAFLGDKKEELKPKEPSWYDKLRGTPVGTPANSDPAHAGLAARARIVDAGSQALKEKTTILPAIGLNETALNAVTGIGSSAIGGLSGLVSMPFVGLDRAASISKQIQDAATYQPRTGLGKLGTELLGAPLGAASEGLRSIGGDVGQAVRGAKGRIAGEEIGGALPAVAATLAGGAGALKGAQRIAALPEDAIPGKDFSPLRDLTPEQQARYEKLVKIGESAPGKGDGIKPTLGQITRDPEQWRFEEQTGKQTTGPGAALRERELDTNASLTKAIEDVDKRVKGPRTTSTEAQTGQSISTALEKKAQAAKANINSLYEKARQSGETKQAVKSDDLEKYLDDEAEEHPSLKVIQSKLQKLKDKNGGKLTVDDAETLYRTASDQTTYGDPSSVYMGRVKQRINDMTDGAGGDLYRNARSARLAYGMEFEDRAGIARLIEKKPGSRTDYRTPTEDVFKKTMLNGSIEEMKDVVRSLKDIDLKKDTSGAQAVRNLQGQTVDYILDRAAKLSENERGQAGVSSDGLKKAINAVGREKIEYLLGPDALKDLESTLNAAKLVKEQPGTVAKSDTAQNLRDIMRNVALDAGKKHLIDSIPVAGKAVSALREFSNQRAQEKAIQDRVTEALSPRKASPQTIKELAQQAKAAAAEKRNTELGGMVKGALPLSVLTKGTQPKGDSQ